MDRRQQCIFGIGVVVVDGVRVLEVEVVAAGLPVVGRDLPGDFGLLATAFDTIRF